MVFQITTVLDVQTYIYTWFILPPLMQVIRYTGLVDSAMPGCPDTHGDLHWKSAKRGEKKNMAQPLTSKQKQHHHRHHQQQQHQLGEAVLKSKYLSTVLQPITHLPTTNDLFQTIRLRPRKTISKPSKQIWDVYDTEVESTQIIIFGGQNLKRFHSPSFTSLKRGVGPLMIGFSYISLLP